MPHLFAADGIYRRRRILIVIATAISLLIAVFSYAALSNAESNRESPVRPADSTTVVRKLQGPTSTSATHNGVLANDLLPALPSTADPATFASLVAHAIFDWDTTTTIPLSAYTSRLVTAADPTGESSPGLMADLAGYLPTEKAWTELRPYSTRQWLKIKKTGVPDLWPKAEAQSGPGVLLPGTTAYTITGVRHRAGRWERKPVTSEHDVAFTVFLVCAPSYPECHLLRLSRLDDPLG